LEQFDVVILGGGAAGLMCAAVAGTRGRRVLVLEGSNKVGKKILMSGGGRCNFTNLNTTSSNFLSANPHFCKSALGRYSPFDFLSLVEAHGIAYHEKKAGQLFCNNSSKDILGMLVDECEKAGVQILTRCDIESVSRDHGYEVRSNGTEYSCSSLVVATGGLSIPKMGASDFGYRLARQFELNVLATRAGLVPFTFSGAFHDLCARLSGVSARCDLTAGGVTFSDDLLFTHRGLSGPAALQASSYWTPGESIMLDLLPDTDPLALLLSTKSSRPASTLRAALGEPLPRALANELVHHYWPDLLDVPLSGTRDETLRSIASDLQSMTLRPSGTEGYRTAEVTLGGVDSRELSSKTMECRRHAGLYFIGELVDVTGHLGGFNFQWAWASAQAAGAAV